MKMFIHSSSTYSPKCNTVRMSFEGVEALPKEVYSFTMFAPSSVKFNENQVNEVPYWLAKNIWNSNSTHYILKELIKQGKATTSKRKEKSALVLKIMEAFTEAEKLNIEEPIEETGEFVGEVGDTIITNAKVDKLLKSYVTTYSGMWKQVPTYDGFCTWAHPSADVCLWQLSDEENHIFILKSTNDTVNGFLSTASGTFQMKAKIIGHNSFRGQKQTVIQVKKQDLTN